MLFILRYHHLRFTGGAETQCWLHATEFARRGWDVHYASEWDNLPEPNPLDGVTLHALPDNPSRWTGNRDAIRRLMSEFEPDVVYTQVADLYSAHAILEASPNAVTIWAAAADVNGRIAEYLKTLWKASTPLRFLKNLPTLWHEQRLATKGMRRANILIAQHRQQQTWFRDMGLESVVIRNSHPEIPPDQVQTHEGVPLVFWAGSVKSWKCPELFLELVHRCRDLPAQFVLAGKSYQDRYLEEMAKLEREQPNFKYAGFIPYASIGEYFARAHIFVSTSLGEGFPNTFVQAWMHGVPVVSLDVNPENLLTTENLVRYVSSMAELEAAVRELVADPGLRRDLGHAAHVFASREFNLQKNIDKIETLLTEKGVRLPAR